MMCSQGVVEAVLFLEHEHAAVMRGGGGGSMKRGTGKRHHINCGRMKKLEGTQAVGVPEKEK